MTSNTKILEYIIFLALIFLIIYLFFRKKCKIKCNNKVDRFENYPRIYEHGNIENGQYFPKGRYVVHERNIGNGSENLPPPSGLRPTSRIGDLCQECIGDCQIKLWAGIDAPAKGKTQKDHCVEQCKLECTVLD